MSGGVGRRGGRLHPSVRPSAGLLLSEALARPTALSTLPVSTFVLKALCSSVFCVFFKKTLFWEAVVL